MIVVLLFSKTFMVSVYPNTTVVVEFANSIHKIKATPGPAFKMPWESVEIIMQKNQTNDLILEIL